MPDQPVPAARSQVNSPGTAGPRTRQHGWFRWLRLMALCAALLAALRMTGCMERLFYHPTAGPTPAMPDAERVFFTSHDGTQLCGWFVPAHADTSPAGTILHVHGNAGNINDHAWFTEYLPPAGFNVFIFDYRGYGQSEGTARRRQPLIEDTNAALEYVLTRDDVDAARIGMYGQSLGGSIGLNVMAERPEIRAAVIESAFDSWRTIAANAVGGDPPAWLAKALAWLLISDAARVDEAIARCSPRPILIVHGDGDRIVPISHGRRLKNAGGSNVTLREYAGGDHNSLRETHPEVEAAVIGFFRSHLSD